MTPKVRRNSASSPPPLAELGQMLVFSGKLQSQQAIEITRQAHEHNRSFLQQLMSMQLLSARELAQTIAMVTGTPLLDLHAITLSHLPIDLLDAKLCLDHQILPLSQRQNRLQVATADPTQRETAQKIQFTTHLGIDWIVVEHDKLSQMLQLRWPATGAHAETMLPEGFVFDATTLGQEDALDLQEDQTYAAQVDDAPVVKFLHKMLIDGIQLRASDLHFEPYEKTLRVRLRIDGELREVLTVPATIKERLASRIKVISRLDISEKRVPQDGRMKLRIHANRVIDFRVSTLPTLHGEKIVIRILDPDHARLGIDALGYTAVQKELLLQAIHRPHGMVLVTGPTGSGKTMSLYTCLNLLNQPGVNICTVEDPSEINLPGVNQVNINEKAGLDFSTALRAFLRQDPDIIMVGEIRDLETADIALKAAQTGHLVLSTLHTNNAPATLTRLLNMGVAPFNIASSVVLITAQRLVRRLCLQCRQPLTVPQAALIDAGYTSAELDGSWQLYRPVGCSACHSGYKGRIGIHQVMPVSEEIQRIILANGSMLDISQQAAREHVDTLRASGLRLVRNGITTLEEVLNVTNT